MNTEFMELVGMFRMVAIQGRLGFGKTGMAVLLAEKLLMEGLVDGVVTNFPSVLPVSIGEDDGTLMNKAIIFDEGWQELDARNWAGNDTDSYGGFARKFGVYWFFPSVYPVDKRLRAIQVKPLYRNPFTEDTTWQYEVNTGDKDAPKGKIAIKNKRFWGMYSTAYIPPKGKAGDCGIKERFKATYKVFRGEEHEDLDYESRPAYVEHE